MALDVLRALARNPLESRPARGTRTRARRARVLDREIDALCARIAARDVDESEARQLSLRLMRTLQATLLVCFAPEPVAATFCRSRFGDG